MIRDLIARWRSRAEAARLEPHHHQSEHDWASGYSKGLSEAADDLEAEVGDDVG